MRHLLVTPLLPIERFAVPFDENAFVDWLTDAAPGEWVIYYRGYLGFERMPSAGQLDRRERADLIAVANRVMVAADQGIVTPLQKRLDTGDYLYFAVKAGPAMRDQCRAAVPHSASPMPPALAATQTFPIALAA